MLRKECTGHLSSRIKVRLEGCEREAQDKVSEGARSCRPGRLQNRIWILFRHYKKLMKVLDKEKPNLSDLRLLKIPIGGWVPYGMTWRGEGRQKTTSETVRRPR